MVCHYIKLLRLLPVMAVILCALTPFSRAGECTSDNCASVGSVQLSVAIGGGVRTNPLHSGDNLPLILLPDIAWYGERFYLDNTEAGYQWLNTENMAFETFVSLNSERGNFSRGHASNFILAGTVPDGALTEDHTDMTPALPDQENTGQPRFLGTDDVAKRDWALDAGMRFHWYQGATEFSVALLQDITSVHRGQQAVMSLKQTWKKGKWRAAGALSVTWKSANLLDYYYGIDRRDDVDTSWFYEADSGLFPAVRLSISRELTTQWHLIGFVKYTHLDDAMTLSPLVQKDEQITMFGGITYRF